MNSAETSAKRLPSNPHEATAKIDFIGHLEKLLTTKHHRRHRSMRYPLLQALTVWEKLRRFFQATLRPPLPAAARNERKPNRFPQLRRRHPARRQPRRRTGRRKSVALPVWLFGDEAVPVCRALR